MAEKHVAGGRKTQTIFSFRPAFLDVFTNLTKPNDKERKKACSELLRQLKSRQNGPRADDEELRKELDYSVKRLVRGMGSGREMARLGYTVALTQLPFLDSLMKLSQFQCSMKTNLRPDNIGFYELVLRNFPDVSEENIFTLMKKNLKTSNQESKYDQSQIVLGQVMVLTSLVVSDRLHNAKKEDIEFVVQELLKLEKKRSYIKQLSCVCLIELSKRVSSEMFGDAIYPLLKEHLTRGWKDCDPDDLHLLLSLSKSQPKRIGRKFLSKHWDESCVVCEENLGRVGEIMMQSTACQPVMHPLCLQVLDEVMQDEELLQTFWSKVVDGPFTSGQTAKKALAYKLTEEALKKVQTSAQFQIIMSRTVIDNMAHHGADNANALHGPAVQLTKMLIHTIKQLNDTTTPLWMIECLLSTPLSYRFDQLTKTKTVSILISMLNNDCAKKFSKKCMKFFSGADDVFSSELKSQDVSGQQCWAVKSLTSLISSGNVGRDTILSVLQFLFLHGYFKVKVISKVIPHCKTLGTPVVDSSVPATAFCKALDSLLTSQPKVTGGQTEEEVQGQTMNKHAYLEILFGVLQYAKVLLENSDVAVPNRTWTEAEQEEWVKSLEFIENISSNQKSVDDMAFHLLSMYTVLQLFKETEDVLEILEDLRICYKKATKKRRKSVGVKADEPEWLEVMMELFLSLLARPSHLCRTVVSTTYRFLCSHMTRQAFSLVTDVLRENQEGEEGPISFEEEEEMSHDEDSESDNAESDDNDEVNTGIDPAFRASIKAALGTAAAESDEESDSDMSDSAMFRLDDALAEAFKSQSKQKASKDKEEKKTQLMNFRLRCLDLIMLQMRHGHNSTSVGMLLDLLLPLLMLMDSTIKDKKETNLYNKCKETINTIFKVKKVITDVDAEELSESLKFCIEYSKKVTMMPVIESLAKSCAFIVRIGTGHLISTGPSPVKTRAKRAQLQEKTPKDDGPEMMLAIYREALEAFFNKRDSRINHLIFSFTFERFPAFVWPLHELMCTVIVNQDGNRKVFDRLQAASLLSSLMKRTLLQEDEDWAAVGQQLSTIAHKVLTELTAGSMKPKLFETVVMILCRFYNALPADVQVELPVSLLPVVKEAITQGNKDMKTACRKFISLCGFKQGSKKSAKKRKHDKTDQEDVTEEKKRKQVEPAATPVKNGDVHVESKTPKSKKKKEKRKSVVVTPLVATPGKVTPVVATPAPGNGDVHVESKTPKSKKKKEKRKSGVVTPVVATPGKVTPVVATPGKVTPVVATPGKVTPVVASPGKVTPVVVTPGNGDVHVESETPKSKKKEKRKSGVATPVVATPGKVTPVVVTPGKVTPVVVTPGNGDVHVESETPKSKKKEKRKSGVATPVVATPGKVTPVVVTPGKVTPVATPGKVTPVVATPGKVTPGVATPRKVTPVVATPGKVTPVVATPGKVTPVVATPGKVTPGVATPGKVGRVEKLVGSNASGKGKGASTPIVDQSMDESKSIKRDGDSLETPKSKKKKKRESVTPVVESIGADIDGTGMNGSREGKHGAHQVHTVEESNVTKRDGDILDSIHSPKSKKKKKKDRQSLAPIVEKSEDSTVLHYVSLHLASPEKVKTDDVVAKLSFDSPVVESKVKVNTVTTGSPKSPKKKERRKSMRLEKRKSMM